jgi:hypothetical protein
MKEYPMTGCTAALEHVVNSFAAGHVADSASVEDGAMKTREALSALLASRKLSPVLQPGRPKGTHYPAAPDLGIAEITQVLCSWADKLVAAPADERAQRIRVQHGNMSEQFIFPCVFANVV